MKLQEPRCLTNVDAVTNAQRQSPTNGSLTLHFSFIVVTIHFNQL